MTGEHEFLIDLCGGNHEAVALIEGAWRFCEVWDDAIDGEKKESDDAINAAFQWALFELNDNAFYRRRPELRNALASSIALWRAANQLEAGRPQPSPDHLHTAYVLRCAPYNFFVAVVLAANGIDAAASAALYFYGRPTSDSLEAYVAEHMKGA